MQNTSLASSITTSPNLAGDWAVPSSRPWRKVLRTMVDRMALAFSIDLRSLAVMRIGMGLILIAQMYILAPSAREFLSDEGFLPRATTLTRMWDGQGQWSLYMINGSVWFAYAMLLAGAVSGGCLCLGYRTRLATIVSWVLWQSLFTRMPIISNGADSVIRQILFWSMFLPMGARWSLDSAKLRPDLTRQRIVTLPGVAFIFQVVYVYWFAFLLKSDPVWRESGIALQLTLNIDQMARPLGIWLRGHADACRWLTFWALWLEAVGPWVALLPFLHKTARMTAIISFLALHIGINLCMDIGTFGFVMSCAWMAFLPSEFWEWVGKQYRKAWVGMRWVRDVETGLLRCAKWIATVKTLITDKMNRMAPKTEPVTASGLTGHSCRYGLKPSLFSHVLVFACLLLTFSWNMRSTDFSRHESWFPREMNSIAFAFGLDQYWGMFAPKPLLEDGWFVFSGHLADGSDVDLMRDGIKVSFDKPELGHTFFKDHRWQKLLMNLWSDRYRDQRPAFCDYIARQWNAKNDGERQVTGFVFYYVMERTNLDGTVQAPERKELCRNDRFWN